MWTGAPEPQTRISPREAMKRFETKGKVYLLDEGGFLLDKEQWDEDFAKGLAPEVGITEGLGHAHWEVLRFIRDTYGQTGLCPVVYKTCRARGLNIKDLQRLFPSGYQRGACKLAGLSFRTAVLKQAELEFLQEASKLKGRSSPAKAATAVPLAKPIAPQERIYRVNVQGFLIDPSQWDEDFAIFKACELQGNCPLGKKHWRIILHLRSEYEKTGEVPTVYALCEAVGIDVDELAELFPTGYHRGAVKIAGLNLGLKRSTGAGVESV